jgi:acyl carrier protein
MDQAVTLDRVNEELVFNAADEEANGTPSIEAIKDWLRSEISELLSIDARDLSVHESLANYGLSSMTGLMLSGNIEAWLGIHVDSSVTWEYRTVELLAGYLAEEVKSQKAALAHR